MILEYVTITGIDDQVDISFIDQMCARFSHLEWGILLSEKRKGQPRYPSDMWLAKLTDALGLKYDTQFAAHLCGSLCERLLADEGVSYVTGELIEHSKPEFFIRLQLNAYPDGDYDHAKVNRLASNVRDIVDIVVPISNDMIMARVQPFQFLGNVVFLHDRSRGRGIEPAQWPDVELHNPCGYAGGINLDNIKSVLDALCERSSDRLFWIDIETGARTDDRLDYKKVEQLLTTTEDYIG